LSSTARLLLRLSSTARLLLRLSSAAWLPAAAWLLLRLSTTWLLLIIRIRHGVLLSARKGGQKPSLR
jgi:hypothetical protein